MVLVIGLFFLYNWAVRWTNRWCNAYMLEKRVEVCKCAKVLLL